MDLSTLQTLDNTYVAPTYGRFPVAIEQGSGAVCTDSGGKQYIDFTAGIGVNALGFCHPQWVEAVSKQAATLNHTSNLYYTEPGLVLAQKLCEKSGMKRVAPQFLPRPHHHHPGRHRPAGVSYEIQPLYRRLCLCRRQRH